MKLATSTNIYFERENAPLIPLEETIRRCAKAGFKNLDFGFAELALVSQEFNGDNWRQEILELKKIATQYGLEFVQAHATIFDFSNENENYEKQEMLFRRSLIGASLLDVPWVVVHPSTCIRENKIHRNTRDKNVQFFKKYSLIAERLGVGLAVENMWGRLKSGEKPYCLDAKELLLLMEDVNCKNIKVCWDVEHASVENLNQTEAIHILKEYIVATHISDETGGNNIHILPYLGKAKWDEILEAFAQINYDGIFDLEIQHYLPRIPLELVDRAMKFSCEVGMQMVGRIEELKKGFRYE